MYVRAYVLLDGVAVAVVDLFLALVLAVAVAVTYFCCWNCC